MFKIVAIKIQTDDQLASLQQPCQGASCSLTTKQTSENSDSLVTPTTSFSKATPFLALVNSRS